MTMVHFVNQIIYKLAVLLQILLLDLQWMDKIVINLLQDGI